jgi:beta-galactosidase
MSSGYEANGYGMINLDGTVTERAEIAGRFAQIIDNNAALFASLHPQESQVAVLYNRLAYMTGGNTVGPGSTVRDSLMGFYRALFERNIQVDFVHPDEILSGRADEYKMIYLAYPLMLSKPVAEVLKEYVRRGGTLVSEARPAWNDERGYANERIPGFGLDEAFGCREKVLRSPEVIEMQNLPPPFAALSGLTVRGGVFAQHLEVTAPSARVLARFPDGDPAMVVSPYGDGQALLIGSFPAAAYEQEQIPATGRFLEILASWAGVEPTIRIDSAPGQVEARFLESTDSLLFIGINPKFPLISG